MIPQYAMDVSESDRRAIIGVCDELVGRAGRTTLMMALRGSRSKRVLQFAVDKVQGYGHFAGQPEAEVMAKIDALIAARFLWLEYRDGFPLLSFTSAGLELSSQYIAEQWLEILESRVHLVTRGEPLELPFLMSVLPQRNHNTVAKVVELASAVADPNWLSLLRAWQKVETRRIRGKIGAIVAILERAERRR